jgi:hypothetical protein
MVDVSNKNIQYLDYRTSALGDYIDESTIDPLSQMNLVRNKVFVVSPIIMIEDAYMEIKEEILFNK